MKRERKKTERSSHITSARAMTELKRTSIACRSSPSRPSNRWTPSSLRGNRSCTSSAKSRRVRLNDEIQAGHGLVIGELRGKTRRIAKEHRELGQERAQIYEARQHRILEDGLIRVLGSKKWVKLLYPTFPKRSSPASGAWPEWHGSPA